MTKTAFERLADGPVRTECLRVAREMIKHEIKRQGYKIAWTESSDVTKATIALCNSSEGLNILKQAKRNLRKLMTGKGRLK